MGADAEVGVVAGFDRGDCSGAGDGGAVSCGRGGGEGVGDEDDVAKADGGDVLSLSDEWIQVFDGECVFAGRESGCVVRC